MENKLNSVIILSILLLVKLSNTQSVSSCSSPLGLESGSIRDSQLHASSSYSSSVGPTMGRLRSSAGGGAWCPASMVSNSSKEWLEVNLEKKMMITGISMQGRWDNGVGQEFAPFVRVVYLHDVSGQFVTYTDLHGGQVFTANIDTYSVAEVKMDPPVVTDRLRVIPVSIYQRSVCIRIEIRGCEVTDVPQLVKEQEKERSIFPIAIGVLITLSTVLILVIIYMLVKMTRSSHLTTKPPTYLSPPLTTQQTTSDYQSNWYLHRPEPVYQEPLKNTQDKNNQIPKTTDQYSVPKTSPENSTYSTPVEIFSSSVTSPHSTLSSVATEWSSLEESSVDSSSGSSTPRLPPLPSFDTFRGPRIPKFEDCSTLSPVYSYFASYGQKYSNIIE